MGATLREPLHLETQGLEQRRNPPLSPGEGGRRQRQMILPQVPMRSSDDRLAVVVPGTFDKEVLSCASELVLREERIAPQRVELGHRSTNALDRDLGQPHAGILLRAR